MTMETLLNNATRGLQSIFLWFYCLPIPKAAILIVIPTLLYLFLRSYFDGKRCRKPIIATLLLASFGIIVFDTLATRISDGITIQPDLVPMHSYYIVFTGGNPELLRSNFMNVVLFYPAGLLAYELLPKTWRGYRKMLFVALIFALLSVGIEVCQYRFALGQAEVDDVIHNTLGALIGAVVCTIHIPWHKLKSVN